MPEQGNPRLRKGDITIQEVLQLSQHVYQKEGIDNKSKRAKLDIISGRVKWRRGLKYDRSLKKWIQISREVLFIFNVQSKPISYKMPYDPIKIHQYPIYVLIKNFELGINSSFKWREGSFSSPKFPKKGMTKQQRENIIKYNLQKQIQLQFFFDLEDTLAQWGLLFGRNRTNGPAKIKNPSKTPFMGKHMLWITLNIFPKLFSEKFKGKIMKKSTKNPFREGSQFIESK